MTLFSDSKAIWWAGTRAVQPDALMDEWLPKQAPVKKPVNVLAVGKAATAMALAFSRRMPVAQGLVITKHGHDQPVPGFEVLTADHPLPGLHSVKAAERVQQFVTQCRELYMPVYFLISGGASALLGDVPPSISLEDWQWLNQTMLSNGLPIHHINHCRRALGTLKGGKMLSQFRPVHVTTLALSDVVGDDPAIIGSGPTIVNNSPDAPDADTLIQTIFPEVCPHQYRLEPLLRQSLLAPPPKDGNGTYHMLGSAKHAISAAAQHATQRGYHTVVTPIPMQLDVSKEAERMVAQLSQPVTVPTCYLYWGEPVITLPPNPGQGGRNQHLALTLAQHMPHAVNWHVLAGGTDGTDGTTTVAGGWVDHHTAQKARTLHLNLAQNLSQANSHDALQTLHQLWVTGPTQTNVMDLVIALRLP